MKSHGKPQYTEEFEVDRLVKAGRVWGSRVGDVRSVSWGTSWEWDSTAHRMETTEEVP